MRVLYSHYLTADDHPAARMVQAVAEELRRLGNTVVVHRSAGEPAPASPPAGGAGTPSLPKRAFWFAKEISRNLASYRRDVAAIGAFRPDVVLCRQDAYRYSMPLACSRSKVPVVTYADAPVAYESRHFNPAGRWHPWGAVESIEKWVLRHSRAVVTVSEPAAALLRRYRLPTPLAVAPNGVDTGRFHPATADERAEQRRTLGVSTPHAVGFVGTFRPFHGLGLLAEIIRRTAHRPDLTWVLVGDGPGRAELESAVRGCPRVVFTGRQPPDAVPAVLASLDVLVSPHQHAVPDFYFCPLKILEAMAAGVPCLASAQGDIPTALGGGGVTVPTDSPKEWADALEGLIDSPAERSSMATIARRRAVEQFTWQQTAAKVEAVLEGACRDEPARAVAVAD